MLSGSRRVLLDRPRIVLTNPGVERRIAVAPSTRLATAVASGAV
jgi:hypothetical protein